MEAIEEVNQKIRERNEKLQLAPELYQVDKDVLILLRNDQEKVLKNAQSEDPNAEGLKKEIKQLQSSFLKTCELRIHQWPVSWPPLLVDPLLGKLRELGISVTIEAVGGGEGGGGGGENRGGGVERGKGGGGGGDNPGGVDRGGGGSGGRANQPVIQPLKPGYTAIGQRILGYAPQIRYFRFQKQEVIQSFKFFVQVNEDNPLRMGTDADLGHPATMAYHNLPEDQKNDVRNSDKRYTRDTPPDKFQGIRGVAYDRSRRATYVWVRMADETEADKAHIMTRTALRNWLTPRFADKCIEDFFIQKDDIPPWAKEDEAQDNHLQLRYPLPKATLPGYHMLSGYSRMNGKVAPERPPDAIEELTDRMNKLLEFVVEDRKEQKEHREMMMRLLPSSQSTD